MSTVRDPVPELKRQLGATLARELAGWRASDLTVLMHAHPSRVSALRRGHLERFSLETLIRYCARLRVRVDLVLTRDRFRSER